MFSKNNLSLSCLTRLCPKTIKRIAKLVDGKPAYIMAGYPSREDVHLADALGLPFLTGNPEISSKFVSAHYSKQFCHLHNFSSVAVSPKIKKAGDIELFAAKMIIGSPKVHTWRLEIDGDVPGRGGMILPIENAAQVGFIRAVEDPHERSNKEKDLVRILQNVIPGYGLLSCPKVYPDYQKFSSILLAKGGMIEMVPKGYGLKTLGVLCFISPDGIFKLLTSYEVLQTDRFFRLGYLWPQQYIPHSAFETQLTPLSKRLYEIGVFGYVTVLFNAIGTTKDQRSFRVYIDRIIPYYDEFTACFESINFMLAGRTPHRISSSDDSSRKLTEQPTTVLILPKIQAIRFATDLNYLKLFERLRERNIQFDLRTRTGTLVTLSDLISKGTLGLMCFEADRDQTIKSMNRVLSNLTALFDQSTPPTEDFDDRTDVVTYAMVLEFLYSMQKQT